jgi:predicted transcriptional regulator
LRALATKKTAKRYLDVIADRVESGLTGSKWTLAALPLLDTQGSALARDRRLVEVWLDRQQLRGTPVHRWELPRIEECTKPFYETVADIMSTDLSTVGPEDPISLAASIMEWRHVRHVPVEDDAGRLVGVLSIRDVVRAPPSVRAIKEVMSTDVVFVSPLTSTASALQLMHDGKIDCLPVVENGQLVGLVTSHDLLTVLRFLINRTEVAAVKPEAAAVAG